MNVILLLVVIFTIVFVLVFIFNFISLLKRKNKKKLLTTYLTIFLALSVFYLYAYFPRRVNRIYLKEDVIKIYCCYPSYTYGVDDYVIEVDQNKYADVYKAMKKAYYIPYYRINIQKSILGNTKYFILQYSNYYVLVGEKGWLYWKGQYREYFIPIDSYNLINFKRGTTKDMKNFDFEELKKQFT